MRIAINGFFLAKPKTGMGQYISSILNILLQESSDTWRIYVPAGYDYSYLPSHFQEALCIRPIPWMRKDLVAQVIWEKYLMPWFARTADVLWVPYQCLTWSTQVRTVMTVHDVIPWRMPEYIPNRQQAWYYDHLEDVLEHVPEIITISNFCRDEIQDVLDTVTHNISVIYPASPKQHIVGDDSLVQHERFVLYVGGLDSRKNVIRLIEAFAEVVLEEPDVHLYIPGNYFENPLIPNIPQAIQEAGLADNVHMLGYVSDSELVGLLQKAEIMVYPSLYEGFGLPILEAMQYQTPVVTSSIGAMAEVAGSAAYGVDPYSVADIARGIIKVLGNKELQQDMIARGVTRAREFSWAKTAQETYAILKG